MSILDLVPPSAIRLIVRSALNCTEDDLSVLDGAIAHVSSMPLITPFTGDVKNVESLISLANVKGLTDVGFNPDLGILRNTALHLPIATAVSNVVETLPQAKTVVRVLQTVADLPIFEGRTFDGLPSFIAEGIIPKLLERYPPSETSEDPQTLAVTCNHCRQLSIYQVADIS